MSEIRDVLQIAVDALIAPRKVRLLRGTLGIDVFELSEADLKKATKNEADIPSLWDQLAQALGHGGEQQEGSRPVPGSRPALDIDIREIQRQISDETVRELRHYQLKPHMATVQRVRRWWDHGEWRRDGPKSEPVCIQEAGWQQTVVFVTDVDLPASLRTLAQKLREQPDAEHLEWWIYRLKQWARMCQRALGGIDEPQPRRIRDTPCPICQATHIAVVNIDGEPSRVPTLLIDFQDGMVRAVECSTCGYAWFRGDDLIALGEQLGTFQAETA